MVPRDLPAPRPPVPPDGPVTVGSLLRREGRAAHSQDRPVVPRARDVADRGPAHRVAVTAGSILAVAAVLGTNVVGEVAFGPGTTDDDGERGFGGAVAPEGPDPLSLTATGAPIGNAMAVLRAAGSPVLAAVNDLAGGPPASGAGIVARALAGLPGSPAVAIAPGTSTAASGDDRAAAGDVAADEDDATADTSDGSRARSSTSSTRSSTRSDSTDADETRSSTRRSSDRVTPTPRRGSGSDDAGAGSGPVRIPPVFSGRGTSGGGTDAPPTTPLAPAPATTPDPDPDGGTGSTPGTKVEDDGDTGGDASGDSPTSEIPTTDSATPDSLKTDSLKTDSADGSGIDEATSSVDTAGDDTTSDDARSEDATSDATKTDDAKADDPASGSSDGSDSSDDDATDSSSS